jgi:hypothetical protein
MSREVELGQETREVTVKFGFRPPWWATPYMKTLGFLHRRFGLKVDVEKVAERIVSHSSFYANGKRMRP